MKTWVLAISALLVACTSQGPRVQDPLGNQQGFEAQLQALGEWSLRGRIAVSDGQTGGSASIKWHVEPGCYDMDLRTALGQNTWRLFGNDHGAMLESSKDGRFYANTAEELLEARLGWQVPLSYLADWVRGARAPIPVQSLKFDKRGRLEQIVQGGWTIKFEGRLIVDSYVMPRKITAQNQSYKVKLIVHEWDLASQEQSQINGCSKQGKGI